MGYRVVGSHHVNGAAPGELVDVSGFTEGQLAALVEAGHIQKERQGKVEASDQEQEEAT